MKVLGDICAPTGTYTKDGEEKTRWGKCGVLMQNAEGQYRIKLDLLPFTGDGWLAVFPKQEQPRQAQPARPPAQDDAFIDSDMPF